MKVVSLVSMKGGVGKTSLAANLACALAKKLGPNAVYALDLDSQNALQWHFGLIDHTTRGVCQRAVEGGTLSDIAHQSDTGVTCFPYGFAEEPTRMAFESLLNEHPDWLKQQLDGLALSKNALVLIDTPPGPSPYLPQALASSALALVVLLPDAASYATVPAMETYLDEMIPLNPDLQSAYVVNQLDESDPLGSDMNRTLRQYLRDRFVPVMVNSDEALREALAVQQSVLAYDPHGQASHDINTLATWLLDALDS
jgi:cellulose synthase operon protein YhjQ